MGFMSNFVNSVPGAGHIKGLYHYAKGEKKEAKEAMYQSTRSLMVIGAGTVGGPGVAIATGMATDAVASAFMGEEKGLIESCSNIGSDLLSNTNPTSSILKAGAQLGFDGLSGYGGGYSGGASKSSAGAFGKIMKRGTEQSIQKSARMSAVASSIAFKTLQTSKLERQAEQVREVRKIDRKWREREHERESTEEDQESECTRSEELQRVLWKVKVQHREPESYWKKQHKAYWKSIREQDVLYETSSDYEEKEYWESKYRKHVILPRKREFSGREPYLSKPYSMYDQSENKQNNQRKPLKSKNQQESEKKEQQANSEKQNRNTSGSTSVSSQPPQPPQGNKDNNKKGGKNKEPTFFENFLALLRKILNIVYGNKSEPFSSIFQALSKEDRKYLAKVLKPLVSSGTLEVVIELVIRMFQQHFPQDISFLNFISLLEFIQTYVTEELKDRTLISSGTETEEAEMSPTERRDKIISEIASEEDIVQNLIEQFDELKIVIKNETKAWDEQFPNFRDIFAAVYHYFKHRKLPHGARILSVKEYYDWIRKYLKAVEQTQKLTELKKSKDQKYVREKFEPEFRRRFKLVLSCHEGELVLSSAYVVTGMLPDDKEKHVIFLIADILTMFTAVYLLYTFRNVLCNSLVLVLNLPLLVAICVFNCTAFIVNFLLNTLIFLFFCLIFILKVFLNLLLIFVFVWYFFFYLPDQR